MYYKHYKGSSKGELLSITIYYKIPKEYEDEYETSLKSFFEANYEDHDIVIVVNGVEETWNKVKEWVDKYHNGEKNVYLLKLDKNLGFARANLIGYEVYKKVKGLPKYVALLNDDLMIFKNSLKLLTIPFEIDEKVAAVQGLIYNWFEENGVYVPAVVARYGPAMIGSYHFANLNYRGMRVITIDRPTFPTFINGSCSVFSTKAIERCGFLWSGVEFFGDDVEYPVRLWRCGYKVVYIPVAVAKHLAGGTSRVGPQVIIYKQGRGYFWQTLTFTAHLSTSERVNSLFLAFIRDFARLPSFLITFGRHIIRAVRKRGNTDLGLLTKMALLQHFLMHHFLRVLATGFYKEVPYLKWKEGVEPKIFFTRSYLRLIRSVLFPDVRYLEEAFKFLKERSVLNWEEVEELIEQRLEGQREPSTK